MKERYAVLAFLAYDGFEDACIVDDGMVLSYRFCSGNSFEREIVVLHSGHSACTIDSQL